MLSLLEWEMNKRGKRDPSGGPSARSQSLTEANAPERETKGQGKEQSRSRHAKCSSATLTGVGHNPSQTSVRFWSEAGFERRLDPLVAQQLIEGSAKVMSVATRWGTAIVPAASP